jgi:hypothetical protein
MHIETFALQYLTDLYLSGYFGKTHIVCDGVYLPHSPACKDEQSWQRAKNYLVEQGYLQTQHTLLSNTEKQQIHPKDLLDYWYFELTEKGRAYLFT